MKFGSLNFQLAAHHTAIVQKAQEAVTNKDPHSWLIPADDLTMLKDNTHFDSAGQIALGERMAKQMIEALTSNKNEAATSNTQAP